MWLRAFENYCSDLSITSKKIEGVKKIVSTNTINEKLDNKLDIAIINLNYFNPDSWNPTNTMEKLVEAVYNILTKHKL